MKPPPVLRLVWPYAPGVLVAIVAIVLLLVVPGSSSYVFGGVGLLAFSDAFTRAYLIPPAGMAKSSEPTDWPTST